MSNATGATLMAAVESGSSGADHSSMAGAHLECRLISISPVQHVEIFGCFPSKKRGSQKGKKPGPRFRWSCSSGWVGDWGWELILILVLDFVATFLSIRVLFWKNYLRCLASSTKPICHRLSAFSFSMPHSLISILISSSCRPNLFVYCIHTKRFGRLWLKLWQDAKMYLKKDGIQLIWAYVCFKTVHKWHKISFICI